jgi:hypothetical protein
MEKLSTVTEETLYYADVEIVLRRIINDEEKALFSIKVGDGKAVGFYNRRNADWNGILGDFWEFVNSYNRDKITLAHCEDLWRTDDRKELDRVYTSYLILSKSIIEAFGGNVCLALNFADDYTAGM